MFKKILVLIGLVSLSVNMCGCAPLLVAGGAVAGGAGTASWISGKLTQEVEASMDETVQAAKSALGSMGLGITSEVRKEKVVQIKGKYTDGKTIWIDIHRISQYASRVAVRVGIIPNRAATRKILDKIMEYLQGQPTSVEKQPTSVVIERKPEPVIVEEPKVIPMEELK